MDMLAIVIAEGPELLEVETNAEGKDIGDSSRPEHWHSKQSMKDIQKT
jgi:hypothetical protein